MLISQLLYVTSGDCIDSKPILDVHITNKNLGKALNIKMFNRFKSQTGGFLSYIKQSLFVVFDPGGCQVNYQLNLLPYLSSLHLHRENNQAIFICLCHSHSSITQPLIILGGIFRHV